MMAQFPSKEIARAESYEYRTLGLGYANIGGLLMTWGIPMTPRRPRDLRRADGDHDRRAYATSAEMAASWAPSRATSGTPSTCCA
jgi:ribonucleoside-diphosphate reductase alpha chain